MIRSKHSDPSGDAPLDPAVQAELDALDAALRGDAIEDDTLAALVRDVQAQAPVLPTELRERLRDDVAAGFPRGRRRAAATAAGGRSAQKRRRFTLIGSGALATGIAGVFALIVFTGGGTSPQMATESSGSGHQDLAQIDQLSNSFDSAGGDAGTTTSAASAAPKSEDLSGTGPVSPDAAVRPLPEDGGRGAVVKGSSSTTSSSTSKSLTPATSPRKVERTVDMEVRVKSGKLDEASGKVGDIVRDAGGYVGNSDVSIGTRGAGSATFTLRVASAKLDDAIARLSKLGTVTSQNQRSTDITSSFDSAQSRLDDANKVRRALLRALSKATTSGEIASLRARIADNRATRANLDRQLAALSRRADLTTVSLTLTAPSSGAAAIADDDGQWSIGDAAGDTVRILGTVTGVLLVAAGAALPFAILALIGLAIYRVRRRVGREAALDA
jgi:hypothetical protein